MAQMMAPMMAEVERQNSESLKASLKVLAELGATRSVAMNPQLSSSRIEVCTQIQRYNAVALFDTQFPIIDEATAAASHRDCMTVFEHRLFTNYIQLTKSSRKRRQRIVLSAYLKQELLPPPKRTQAWLRQKNSSTRRAESMKRPIRELSSLVPPATLRSAKSAISVSIGTTKRNMSLNGSRRCLQRSVCNSSAETTAPIAWRSTLYAL